MDPVTPPPTPVGEQLEWLMTLAAEPAEEALRAHFAEETIAARPALAADVLELATALRALTGKVVEGDEQTLRVELGAGRTVAEAVVAVDPERDNLITRAELRQRAELPSADLDRVQRLYDDVAPSYEGSEAAHTEHYSGRAATWLAEAVENGFVVLDVGCGPGHLTAGLDESVRVLGSDLSPEMIRLAQENRPSGTFAVHDYHRPFPADWPAADVTVALGCLDLCTDLDTVIGNVGAATKAGGRMLATVPRLESQSPAGPERELNVPVYDVAIRLRSDDEVRHALDGAGLEVTGHEIIPGFTAPGIGAVNYGLWELRATATDGRG